MNPRLCLLVAAVTVLRPAVAHFWPPAHPFHAVPNEAVEPATFFANVLPNVAHPQQQQAHNAFPPNRFWKSDSVFLFRPLVTSAWSAGPEQRMRLHNPFMERLLAAPYRRPRFGSYFNADEFGKRRHRARGMRGEINVKWSVMPIWERRHRPEPANRPQPTAEDNVPRPSNDLVSRPRPGPWPALAPMHPLPLSGQQVWSEEDISYRSGQRERRQIGGGNWNPQPLLNRFLSNATGLFDNLGRQMTRQLQSSVTDASKAMNGMFSGVFSSMQDNFRRFINLNVAQLRPDKLLSQIASLTRVQ